MPFAVICDDEPEISELLCRMVKRLLPYWEVRAFSAGESLLADGILPELLLLDIDLGGTDGIETARRLRAKGWDGILLFITGIRESVFEAFDVGAFHYLLKPVDGEKLKKVLERAVGEIERKNAPDRRVLLIRTRDRSVTLHAEEIYYLENEMRKIAVHAKSGTVTYYGAMSKAEESLGEDFFRCHRGYLVNMAHIAEYDSGSILLENGETICMAKEKYGGFVKCYLRFLRGKGAYDV